MSIVDRYLCSVFVTTFLICFLSFSGLFIVLHLFNNLDELNAIATKFGWSAVFLEFYLPRIVDLFTKSTGILILFASVFSVSLLQRRREMTAMEAAGLTKLRILRPIFIISFILIGLTVANRELLIPRLQTQLARTPQSWGNTGKAHMPTLTDENNVTVQGDRFYFADQRITNVQIELPTNVAPPTAPLRAETGFVKEAETWRPAGIILHSVTSNMGSLSNSIKDDNGELLVYMPADYHWLSGRQLFVRCNFSKEQIAFSKQQEQYQSTRELITTANKPKRWSNHRQYINIHTRLVRPILDVTLLLLGLPLVIGSIERNVFISAGTCFGIVGLVQLTSIVCYSLGASSLIHPAALAAWTPVLLYVPAAMVAMRGLRR